MGRRGDGGRGARRGAHRSEPPDAGVLRRFGGVLESTVPKKVEPPRLLNVLVVSGIVLGLILFGYSTTQIYLQFGSTPGGPDQVGPVPGVSENTGPSGGAGQGAEADPGEGAAEGGRLPPQEEPGSQTQGASGPTTVEYRLLTSSATDFTAQVTVTNTSAAVMHGWELALGFDGVQVTSVWDADWERMENGLIARQPSWQDGLAPGETATIHFAAEGPPQSPARCSLNGHVCHF